MKAPIASTSTCTFPEPEGTVLPPYYMMLNYWHPIYAIFFLVLGEFSGASDPVYHDTISAIDQGKTLQL